MNEWRLEEAFVPAPDVVPEHIDKAMAQPPDMPRVACALPIFDDWIQTFYAMYGHMPAGRYTATFGSWETVELPLTPE